MILFYADRSVLMMRTVWSSKQILMFFGMAEADYFETSTAYEKSYPITLICGNYTARPKSASDRSCNRGFGSNIDPPFRRKSDLQAGLAQVLHRVGSYRWDSYRVKVRYWPGAVIQITKIHAR